MTTEVEALILLAEAGAVRPEEVERATAAVGGRIVAGFLPHALIVRVTEEAVDDLRQSLGAATVYTEAVPATAVEACCGAAPQRVGGVESAAQPVRRSSRTAWARLAVGRTGVSATRSPTRDP